jgi:tetratricopeptide (TPR) repeat protein
VATLAFIDVGTPTAPAWSAQQVRTLTDLGLVLRELRRRQARRGGGVQLSYRDLAAATGWSHGIIGEYMAGRVLPPTDRFDILIRLLGATTAEQGALATARDRVEESRRAAPAPRQLPADVFGFTGRETELGALDALLDQDAAICAVAGTAGVGKTALAVHWAHRVAKRFPHGQLYIDLRGYDPDEPVPPAEALARLVRGLGVRGGEPPGDVLPEDLAERAARYRSALAGRRVLVVLDNASGTDQVRPLLPGEPGCFALVTSRDSLAGLVVRDGAQRIDLDLLRPDQARRLLETLIGARAVADPQTTGALARSCARLPLALRIAAEIATARPALALPDLLADLRDEQRRLDLLEVPGDARSALRAVFSWSLRQMSLRQSHPAAAAFPLLGLHPGRELSGYAFAALAGCPLEAARGLLADLLGAHLVMVADADSAAGALHARDSRYTMHDLLRAYAVELAAALPTADRQAAQHRLADHYLATAAAAMDTLYPHERASRPAVRPAVTPAPPVQHAPDALRFLDRERANLVALAGQAARYGRPADAVTLSGVLWRYFEVGGHHQEALTVHTLAVAATAGDAEPGDATPGRATAQASLGGIHWWLGDHRGALAPLEAALAGFRQAGDPDGEAHALARLALVHERLGEYPRALAELTGALGIYRRTGNRHGAARQLMNLGILHRRLGRYRWSAGAQRAAARVFQDLGDRRLEGYALGNLAAVENLLGRHAEAQEHLRQSLAACRDTGDRGGEGSALATIGAVYQRMCRYPEALDHLDQGLRISRETGDRALETETLSALGLTLLAMGLPGAALVPYRGALALADAAGDRYEQARALAGVGQGLAARGDAEGAAAHWERALSIYQALGVPEAEALRHRTAQQPAGAELSRGRR